MTNISCFTKVHCIATKFRLSFSSMTTIKPECREPTTLDSLKCLVLDIAQQRSLNDLLWLIVRRLADRPTVVLARIWLIRPGDICSTCRFKEECPDQTRCLHLVASAGRSGGRKQDGMVQHRRILCSISIRRL